MNLTNSTIALAAAAPTSGEVSGSVGGLLFFILVAIAFSYLCSMLEAGILSTPTSYIETQKHSRSGRLMQKFKNNIEEPISAILTLNTFAHTFGAAGAGAQAVGVFGSEWAAVITVILTLMILVLSEIIPKTVGAVYWKQLFTFNAYALQVLVWMLYPAVWALNWLTHLITPNEQMPTVTRLELEMMAQISAVEGALDQQEGLIVRNLLKLNQVQVGDIMTPRTVMLSFSQDLTVGEVQGNKAAMPYSRLPVYREHVDDITGFVLRLDILNAAAEDRDNLRLKELVRPIHSVPETLNAAKALGEFMARQEHIFLVMDEYGGTAGIITLEDAIESLLGAEITDESDVVADMRQLAEQRYKRRLEMINTALIARQANVSENGTSAESQEENADQAESETNRPEM
jgi:CBS domain containing-hemolysin-like protein